MCQDPNAAARQQAKLRHQNKEFAHASNQLKYWNKEVGFKKKRNFIKGRGRSYEIGNFQTVVNIQQGKDLFSRQKTATAFFAGLKDTSDGSRTAGRKHKLETLYNKYAEADYKMEQLRGFGQANFLTGLNRKQQHLINKNREELGGKPQFGPPTMMPGRDTTGMILSGLQTGLSIATPGRSLFSPN